MPLSPLDIESKRFRREMFGVRRADVETFLQASADALSQAILERDEAARLVAASKEQLEQYVRRERTLVEGLAATERVAEERKGRARQEAERIIADARRQAEQIIQRTRLEAERVEKQILRLKVERESFESRLNGLLDEHRRLLEIRRQEVGVAEQIRARSMRPPGPVPENE